MKVYIHKTIHFGIEYTPQGTLNKVLVMAKIDKVEWEGIRHEIPYYEDELKKENYVHYVSDEY